jgi:hypothetical protein
MPDYEPSVADVILLGVGFGERESAGDTNVIVVPARR